MFPRLQKRGPIEAIISVDGVYRVRRFPRLQKRGPIEATRIAVGLSTRIVFPRLQKRGPIEALGQHTPTRALSRFHAYKSVAPLKHHAIEDDLPPVEIVSTLTKAWPH